MEAFCSFIEKLNIAFGVCGYDATIDIVEDLLIETAELSQFANVRSIRNFLGENCLYRVQKMIIDFESLIGAIRFLNQ